MLATLAILAVDPITLGLGALALAAIFGLSGCSDNEDEKAKAPDKQRAESASASSYTAPIYDPVNGINCKGTNMTLSFPYLDTSLLKTVSRLKGIEEKASDFFSLYPGSPMDGDLARIDFSRVCPAVPDGVEYDPEDVALFTIRSSDKRIDYSVRAFVKDRSMWNENWVSTQQELYKALEGMGIQNMGEAAIPLGQAYGPVVFDVAEYIAKSASEDKTSKKKTLETYLSNIAAGITKANSKDSTSFLETMKVFSSHGRGDETRDEVRNALLGMKDPFIKEFIKVFIEGGYALSNAYELYKDLESLKNKGEELPESKVKQFKEELIRVAFSVGIPEQLENEDNESEDDEDDRYLKADTLKIDLAGKEITSLISYDKLTTESQRAELRKARKLAYTLMLFARSLDDPKEKKDKPRASTSSGGKSSGSGHAVGGSYGKAKPKGKGKLPDVSQL